MLIDSRAPSLQSLVIDSEQNIELGIRNIPLPEISNVFIIIMVYIC